MIDSDPVSSPPLVSPSRPAGAAPHDTSPASPALVELLGLAEQWAALEDAKLELGTQIEQRHSEVRVLQMSINLDERRLRSSGMPDSGQGERENAVAEAKSRRDQLTGELEAFLRQSAEARDRVRKDQVALRQRADAALDRLSPQHATVYRRLTEAGIAWPIVRAEAGSCGGCGVAVPPPPASDACVCRACGRLVVSVLSPRPGSGH